MRYYPWFGINVTSSEYNTTETLENDIYYFKLQKYIVKIACIFLENITLVLVTTMRVKREEEALRQRQSRNFR